MSYIIPIEIGGKTINFKTEGYAENVDVDNIISIDHANVVGELLLNPVSLNNASILSAQADKELRLLKIQEDIVFGTLWGEKKDALTIETTDSKGNVKFKAPTINDLENAVKLDPRYTEIKKKIADAEQGCSIAKSFMFSLKAKGDALLSLSKSIVPEDFSAELIENQINEVIKKNK